MVDDIAFPVSKIINFFSFVLLLFIRQKDGVLLLCFFSLRNCLVLLLATQYNFTFLIFKGLQFYLFFFFYILTHKNNESKRTKRICAIDIPHVFVFHDLCAICCNVIGFKTFLLLKKKKKKCLKE